MRGTGIVVAAAVVAVVVGAIAFVLQLYAGLGCSLNENKQPGSELDRVCDGALGSPYAAIVPIAVVIAAAGATVWKMRVEPLVIGGCLALVLALVPLIVMQESSDTVPVDEQRSGDPPAPVSGPVPIVEPPGSSPILSPEERAVETAEIEVRQVHHQVGQCFFRNVPAKACEDPIVRRDDPGLVSEIRVRVDSLERWRVSARTRGVRPAHTFTMDTDIARGRIVHTCVPRGTEFCPHGDPFVERLDTGAPG